MRPIVRFTALLLTLASPAAAADLVVIDGDTFRMGRTTIRIENIDAPEVRDPKCGSEKRLGDLAAQRLAELLASDAIVLSRNPADSRDEDRYGRKLRRVAVDGVDVGETLVSEGLARRWSGRRHPWCR